LGDLHSSRNGTHMAFIRMRVHVLGNVAVDETLRVKCIPVPGQSVLAHTRDRDLGGKGANQAIIAARAGINVRLIAAVGDDEAGHWITRELAAEGLDLGGLLQCRGSSDVSVIIVGETAENMIVTTHGAANHLTSTVAEQHIQQAEAGDLLVLQGNLDPDVTGHALRLGRAQGLTTVLNPSPTYPAFSHLWSLLDLAVLNESEALQLTGAPDIGSAGRSIVASGTRQVVITRGRAGAVLVNRNAVAEVPAVSVAAVDATGAGDTFIGILIAVLARLGTLDLRALAAATEAAAITVSRPGTRSAFPTREEIATILACHELL
jgi:ribokinase